MSKISQTIQVSNTVDQYARRIHINVRGDKVTMVNRWKDSKSNKAHTQRVTLDDAQVSRLLTLLTSQTDRIMARDEARLAAFRKMFEADLKTVGII